MAQVRVVSLGGIGAPCCCGGCTVTITPSFCGAPIADCGVAIYSGASLIASGTTDGTGSVTLTIPSAGTYTVKATLSGFDPVSASRALTCGGTAGIAFSTPTALSVTDSYQTTNIPFIAGGSPWIYSGCYELPEAETGTPSGSGALCTSAAITSGNCDIFYEIQCNAGTWSVYRAWGACCWSTPVNTPPFTCVYASSGLQSSGCDFSLQTTADTGSVTPAVLSFPFNVTLSLGSLNCGGAGGSPNCVPPLGATITINN